MLENADLAVSHVVSEGSEIGDGTGVELRCDHACRTSFTRVTVTRRTTENEIAEMKGEERRVEKSPREARDSTRDSLAR